MFLKKSYRMQNFEKKKRKLWWLWEVIVGIPKYYLLFTFQINVTLFEELQPRCYFIDVRFYCFVIAEWKMPFSLVQCCLRIWSTVHLDLLFRFDVSSFSFFIFRWYLFLVHCRSLYWKCFGQLIGATWWWNLLVPSAFW